ncbi:MAG: hypothetical protein EP343_01100 [Deltaproteobacteria bacterium]|nr:MAG: hypothetical protein EP343_01100 [Deltaproteobacteria bacterium]
MFSTPSPTPQTAEGPRPGLPMVLTVLALLLLLALWWKQRSASQPPQPLTAPTSCKSWVSLAQGFAQPRTLCWTPKALSSRRILERWREVVQQARPTCRVTTQPPLPRHGQELSSRPLANQGSRSAACTWKIRWMPGAQRITLGISLSVNHDSANDLAAIPGLSSRLARRIVQNRRRRGLFPSLSSLTRIRGIGPRTVQRIRKHLTLQR